MTEEQALDIWRKYRNGIDSSVEVVWRGAVADNDPDYRVAFRGEAVSGKFFNDLLTEVKGSDLALGIEAHGGYPFIVLQ